MFERCIGGCFGGGSGVFRAVLGVSDSSIYKSCETDKISSSNMSKPYLFLRLVLYFRSNQKQLRITIEQNGIFNPLRFSACVSLAFD